MATREEVYALIDNERQYQDNILSEHPYSIGEWLLIIEAELNEAKDDWAKEGEIPTLFEIIQIAAVACACLKQHLGEGWRLVRGTAGTRGFEKLEKEGKQGD